MTIAQGIEFAIRGINNGTEMSKMLESAKAISSLRRDMNAAGSDVPERLRPQYEAVERFEKAMAEIVVQISAKYGLGDPRVQPAAQQENKPMPTQALKGKACDCFACATARGSVAKAPRDRTRTDEIEEILAILMDSQKADAAKDKPGEVKSQGFYPGKF